METENTRITDGMLVLSRTTNRTVHCQSVDDGLQTFVCLIFVLAVEKLRFNYTDRIFVDLRHTKEA